MNVTRTAAFVLGAGAVAALIASATTTGRRPASAPVLLRPAAVELRGAELAAEIARLQERLRPTAAPTAASRNLFRFGASSQRRAEPDVAPEPAQPTPMVRDTTPSRPLVTLVGLAEDVGDTGPIRTAIISAFGDVFLVRTGDTVGARFRVASVTAVGADLVDQADGSTLRLSLK